MKKILKLMLLTVFILSSLVGCKSNSKNTNENASKTIEPTSLNIKDMLEQDTNNEDIISIKKKEMFNGVDTLKGTSKETYLGTLKDTTNEFSAILMDSSCENLAAITFKSDKIPEFSFFEPVNMHDMFFLSGFINTTTGERFDKEADEYYFLGEKEFNIGYSNPKIKITTNTLTSNKTRCFNLTFNYGYLSMGDDLSSPEKLEKKWGIKGAWQYKNYIIVFKDSKYIVYVPTSDEYDHIELEINVNNSKETAISNEEIKEILDCITFEFTTSEEKNFNPNHCYIEDAVAKVLNEKYSLAVRDPFRLANISNKELIYIFKALENEKNTAEKCYCIIEPTTPRYIDEERMKAGKYDDYLVLAGNDEEPDLIKILDTLTYDDRVQYQGISFKDGNIGHKYYFSLEELKDYFLR